MSQNSPQPRALPPRRLKACRTCRRQKMRCDGNPDTPCQRCVNAGVECLFDLVERKDNSEAQSSRAQKRKIDALQEELQLLKETINKMARPVQTTETQHAVGSPWPSVSHLASMRDNSVSDPFRSRDFPGQTRDIPSQQERPYSVTSNVAHNDATGYSQGGIPAGPADEAENTNSVACVGERSRCIDQVTLSAPLTAVYAITPPPSASLSHHQASTSPLSNSFLPESINRHVFSPQIRAAKSINPPELPLLDQDAISKMFPQESEARNLFALYMVGANPFIPLFDPIADTFDSLRRRSAFCLVTILYIALCQTESDTVAGRNEESENKKKAAGQISRLLATESLFENPARIESVQAMILLAAFSEKVWFAIGHALQMALDLGLDESFDRITKGKSSSPAETYALLQRTRTWLILYHIEREFAFGTSKQPRIANISSSALRKLYNMDITTSSDIRYISIIELVQLRGSFQFDVESCSINTPSPLQWVDGIERRIREWYNVWDANLCNQGADTCCFSRTSLWIQQAFATLSIYCDVLSKLQKNHTPELRSSMDEIMSRMAMLSVNLLQFIGKSSSYQWHFKWAPTYSALMLTFLAMLAFQISEKSPDLINRALLVVQVVPITRMLQTYPHTQRLASHLEQITQSFEFEVTGDMADDSNDRVLGQDKNQSLLQSENPAEMFTFDYENLDLFLAPGYMDNFSID